MFAKRAKRPDFDKIADLMETWAYLRKGYLRNHGVGEPVTADDLDKMAPDDLLIWAEATGVEQAAMILREPTMAGVHLPDHTQQQWAKALEEALQ